MMTASYDLICILEYLSITAFNLPAPSYFSRVARYPGRRVGEDALEWMWCSENIQYGKYDIKKRQHSKTKTDRSLGGLTLRSGQERPMALQMQHG